MTASAYDHAAAAVALHEVATFIGRLPADVPNPYVDNERIRWAVYSDLRDDQFRLVRTVAQQVRHLARALGGRWQKNDPSAGTFDELYYTLTSANEVGGRKIEILCQRTSVCERVQIGTEQVVVPAQEARAERQEERPVYRFDCKPLNDAAGRELDDILAEVTA